MNRWKGCMLEFWNRQRGNGAWKVGFKSELVFAIRKLKLQISNHEEQDTNPTPQSYRFGHQEEISRDEGPKLKNG